ncbi:hypothetical protein XENOCAPTIV_017149, partial [Xenoophorus captivus]
VTQKDTFSPLSPSKGAKPKLKKLSTKGFCIKCCGKVPLSSMHVPEVSETKKKSTEHIPVAGVQSEQQQKRSSQDLDSHQESSKDIPGLLYPSKISHSEVQQIHQTFCLDVTEDENKDEDSESTDIFTIFTDKEETPSKDAKPFCKIVWQRFRTFLAETFGSNPSKAAPIQLAVDPLPQLVVPDTFLSQMSTVDKTQENVGTQTSPEFSVMQGADQYEAAREKAQKSKNAVRVLVRKIISHCIEESGNMCSQNVFDLIEEHLFSKMWSEAEGELLDIDPEKIENCDTAILKDLCKIFKNSFSLLDYLYLDKEPSLYHEILVSCAKKHLGSLKKSS